MACCYIQKDDNFHIANLYRLEKLKYRTVIMSTVLVKFHNDYKISFNYCNNKIPYCMRDKISTDFYFFYSNSCTLLNTLKTPIHINTLRTGDADLRF